jgi:hypothetical protein
VDAAAAVEAAAAADVVQLDLQLAYLWRVHRVDYYGGVESSTAEDYEKASIAPGPPRCFPPSRRSLSHCVLPRRLSPPSGGHGRRGVGQAHGPAGFRGEGGRRCGSGGAAGGVRGVGEEGGCNLGGAAGEGRSGPARGAVRAAAGAGGRGGFSHYAMCTRTLHLSTGRERTGSPTRQTLQDPSCCLGSAFEAAAFQTNASVFRSRHQPYTTRQETSALTRALPS